MIQQYQRDSSSSSSSSTLLSTRVYLLGNLGNNNNNRNREPQTAYIIERIGDNPNECVYKQIADMCIDVFFKEQLNARPEDKIPPWKEAQIAYLKTLQTGDLQLRREKYAHLNEMFVAYEVLPATQNGLFRDQSFILDLNQVYNLPPYVQNQSFRRGEILGFCEITQRPYGLGGAGNTPDRVRPVLTNLAVSQKARKLGIGSKLLDECERHVARQWKLNEVVLEVEDYNTRALDFYAKRGYDIIFRDPASRRFDVSGVVLRKIRCTRTILRKLLTQQPAQITGDEPKLNSFDLFQRFRETVAVFS